MRSIKACCVRNSAVILAFGLTRVSSAYMYFRPPAASAAFPQQMKSLQDRVPTIASARVSGMPAESLLVWQPLTSQERVGLAMIASVSVGLDVASLGVARISNNDTYRPAAQYGLGPIA